ncbi:FixH family protein [Pedobacter alpinus]|uniref:FixH family protein n=1 Tax=Pedobacter alpinus TaxID=1590643 RepID=A0ABW5TRU0_9SPHI
MNWGKGLVIFLAAFMIFISVLVVKMFSSAEDNFDKDYYEKGLAYDKEYDLKQNVINDKVEPTVSQNDDYVSIRFNAVDSGVVAFKRPSSQLKDQVFTFKDSVVQIPKTNFEKGEWKMVMNWSANQKNYLFYTNLFMP